MVEVTALTMVLAVVLTAYDEDIEELAGGCGGLEAYVSPFHTVSNAAIFLHAPRHALIYSNIHLVLSMGGGTFFTTDTSFPSALNRCD